MPRLKPSVVDDRKWDAARMYVHSSEIWRQTMSKHGMFSDEEQAAYATMKKDQRRLERVRKL